MMEESRYSFEDIPFEIRVVLYRGTYSRILRLLRIQCSGYVFFRVEQVDDAYIRMRKLLDEIATSSGFEVLKVNLPSELPETLHHLTLEDMEFFFEYSGEALSQYKGEILKLYHDVVPKDDYSGLLEVFFESHDKFLSEFEKNKQRVEKQWWDQVKQNSEQRTKTQPNTNISVNVEGDIGGDLIVSGHDTHINSKDKGSRDTKSDEEEKN